MNLAKKDLFTFVGHSRIRVQNCANAIGATIREQQFTWVDEGFTRISGYSFADALGHTAESLLTCEKSDSVAVRQLQDAVSRVEAFHGEMLHRRKDGQEYWVKFDIQPLRNESGLLAGYMIFESDITERVQSLQRLELTSRELIALRAALETHTLFSIAD